MLFRLCNAVMGMNYNMLGDDINTKPIKDSAKQVKTVLQVLLDSILGFAALAAAIYAIVITIQFFRADSAEKREEAKKRLIYAIIGLVAAVVIIVIVNFVANNILEWTGISTTD